ncbi:MAG: lipid-A-disaccharide synthase-related protein [Cyanobacteria bacterium J06626_23]
MPHRILFISNGHGEDNHSSYIIRRLQLLRPELEFAAIPIVGHGRAYSKLGIPIKAPTMTLPSGGFTFMNQWKLVDDFRAGLLQLTLKQIQAVRREAPHYDLVFATGDGVGQSFAWISGKPFFAFISTLSALYEGRLPIDWVLGAAVRSHRCQAVFTRDAYTAKDLQHQGIAKAKFGGIPFLDWMQPQGKDLQLKPDRPMLAMLPGSRLPEARRSLQLLLSLALEIAQRNPNVQFRAALVGDLMTQLPAVAAEADWRCEQCGSVAWLSHTIDGHSVEVGCYSNAFSDIVCASTLVLGMAGLAVDQSAAIGKPVLLIPGQGPQFTYAFAEAQSRLLGLNAKMVGTGPATSEDLMQAADMALDTLNDADYLAACVKNGEERFGPYGGSYRMAQAVIDFLDEMEKGEP